MQIWSWNGAGRAHICYSHTCLFSSDFAQKINQSLSFEARGWKHCCPLFPSEEWGGSCSKFPLNITHLHTNPQGAAWAFKPKLKPLSLAESLFLVSTLFCSLIPLQSPVHSLPDCLLWVQSLVNYSEDPWTCQCSPVSPCLSAGSSPLCLPWVNCPPCPPLLCVIAFYWPF